MLYGHRRYYMVKLRCYRNTLVLPVHYGTTPQFGPIFSVRRLLPMTVPAAERLRSAINHALARGITSREIFTMVATAPPPRPWPDDPDRIIYDEVPEGWCLGNNLLSIVV